MNRQHTFTKLLIGITILAVIVLTGCSDPGPAAADAQNYTQAVLDLVCKGDYDHSVDLADIEDDQELSLRDRMVSEILASLADDAELTDDVKAEFRDVLTDAFSKCKYTVGDAVPSDQGGFDVLVSIEPFKLFYGVSDKLENQISTAFGDVDDVNTLTQEEYNSRIYSLMAKLIRENLRTPFYDAPVEVVVHYGLLDEASNAYGISDEEGAKLGPCLFSTSQN